MKQISTETKVGIFVVIGIIVLAYLTVNIEKIRVGRAVGYTIFTKLDSAAGLVKNSPVRIAGVEIGRVEDITLEAGKARVTLHLPVQTSLPFDSLAFVKSEGLLGEKYIEIKPGIFTDVFIQPNGEIKQGTSVVDIDQLVTQLSSVAADIRGVTSSLNRVLGGERGEDAMRRIFNNIEEITVDLNTTVKENKDRFGTVIGNFENLTRDFASITVKAGDTFDNMNLIAKRVVNGEGTLGRLMTDSSLYEQTSNTMASLSRLAKKAEDGEGTLGKLMADQSLYDQTVDTIATLNKITKKIENGEGTLGRLVADNTLYDQTSNAMTSISEISKTIETGKGTLGKLASDDSLYKEAKKAVRSVNKAAEGIEEMTPVTVLGTIFGLVF
ncbi:MAG: MlaD family protein [Thermodesulfobacteriota bacterium]|nr:MlaD family protein [Thermodesulfobacteriota bacterium]